MRGRQMRYRIDFNRDDLFDMSGDWSQTLSGPDIEILRVNWMVIFYIQIYKSTTGPTDLAPLHAASIPDASARVVYQMGQHRAPKMVWKYDREAVWNEERDEACVEFGEAEIHLSGRVFSTDEPTVPRA